MFRRGTGRDVAVAAAGDKVGVDCELVRGLPALSVADASVDESDFGPTTMTVTVALSGPVRHRVVVRFATADGTAAAPGDYAATAGVLSFAPGTIVQTIPIAIMGDHDFEADETFSVFLSDPVDAAVARGRAIATIRNEDVPPPRSGRYTGTTRQSRSISFEVSADGLRLSRLVIRADISCSGEVLPDEEFAFGDATIPIFPTTRAFGGNIQVSEGPQARTFVTLMGSFATVPGGATTASGTFRLAYVVSGPPSGVCTAENIPWTAS
ncbi:MAG TPA: Calx-beta domain-containing protein [Gaiellaceae bacterium]|nr:Calx-beta domain-containing protein [Gaiellaceae bacterium]